MWRRAAALSLVAAGWARGAPLEIPAGPPSPESVLGFRLGEDRRLPGWGVIVDYFRRLDAASARVTVEEVGRSTEGSPFLVATITSEANGARLEEIRQVNLRLSDPRGLDEDEARRLIARGRTVVALNHGIHSTEVAGPLAAIETAFRLATSNDPEVLDVLDRTVVLMIPSHNPDGTEKVADWYRRTLGTPYEGGEIPFLYQKYVGHDNNRDWYMFTQVESRLTVAHVHDRWRPQIVHDVHQMGTRGARMFLPPYLDPWEPNVDPALIAAVNALGAHAASRLVSEGRPGVVTHAIFDAWSPARAYPFTHGGVRVLSESASARLATPIEVRRDELEAGTGYDPRRASWNFPVPWPGGRWRLRDIVDQQVSASFALLDHAARHRDQWLRTFVEVSRRAAARSQPHAFVFPAEQKDPRAAARLLQVLRTGAVEVHRARARFEAGGREHAAGAHVVLMQQPFSAFAKSLLEQQHYPDLRQYPGGPPVRPYDATAHTLPLMMGVDVFAVGAPFRAELEDVPEVAPAAGRVEGRGRWLALGHKNADLVALGRLLRQRVNVAWALEGFVDGAREFPPGTLLVPSSARSKLEPIARALGIVARAVTASPARVLRLRAPRVGVYRSWVATMDEGWTRFVFEHEVDVAYETLHDRDVRTADLRGRFDVIVLPDQSPASIVNGHARGSLPPEYTGGMGAEGVARLRSFVADGGTLVALDSASLFAIQELGVPVVDALASDRDEAAGDRNGERVFCPGAILRVSVDRAHPLGHGLEPSTAVWFENSPAFEVRSGTVVARYPDENPLLSGWLIGDRRLRGRAALVEAPLGRGRVVLFGFRPQYRAQTWATYIPLLNAIYTSAATATR